MRNRMALAMLLLVLGPAAMVRAQGAAGQPGTSLGAAPGAAPGMTASPTPAEPALTAQQARMRACNADAATRNLSGDPRQRFMNACLSGTLGVGATGGAADAAQGGGGPFGTEAEARRGCGPDAVVWANQESQVFHAAGTQFHGRTQQGSYMCQRAAERAGYRVAGGRS